MSSHQRPSKTAVVTDFRRGQIMDAARESFGKHGLSRTTVDDIAKRAGVAKGTVYLYFKSKQEILRQVLDEDLTRLHDDTVPLLAEPGPLDHKLTAFLTGALTLFDLRRDFFENVHGEMGADLRRKALQKLELVFRAQVESWRGALGDARAAGLVGDVDLDTSALMIVGLASGLAKQRMRGWAADPIADVASRASAALWKGLAAR